MHALVHSFDDIKQKGGTHNYNTKPNEKLHGPLKKTYKMHTNFKDVGPQILKLKHLKFIFSPICSQLDNMEWIKNEDKDMDEVPEVLSSSHPLPDVAQCHSYRQLTMMFTVMEESLHTFLASWLTKELPAYGISVPSPIEFSPDDPLLDAPISTPPTNDYFDKAGDYLVMDVVDHTRDLFLHCITPPFSTQQENMISNYNGKDMLVDEEQMDKWFCTSYEQSSASGPSLVQVP
ncbi:hypothetical protein BJV74DRAFT_794943 [Russula compacta]|nr:hypothetical protein BJV74DRAFT_794943 [Russula compacta]